MYWHRDTDGNGSWRKEAPSGADLSALRRGAGREPGTVPSMWPLYTTLTTSGDITRALEAEHIVLSLFGIHQQSSVRPMHRNGVKLGTAVRNLHHGPDGRFSEPAVTRRFTAALASQSLTEMAAHLRGLVNQLKTIKQPLSYDELYKALKNWHNPDSIRRSWAAQYFSYQKETAPTTDL